MTKPYGRIYKNKTNVSIDVLDLYNVWPVGSIYISVNNTNPSTYFGGTWVSFGAGRCLVGVDENDTDFNIISKTGGEKTHKHLTPLSWLESPRAIGVTNDFGVKTRAGSFYGIYSNTGGGNNVAMLNYYSDSSTNLQPYITVYMWKRIN